MHSRGNCFNPSQVQFTLYVESQGNKNAIGFQSLTGSIHTSLPQPPANPQPLFQSLTGSIHKPRHKRVLAEYGWFQSLTGSIHTV